MHAFERLAERTMLSLLYLLVSLKKSTGFTAIEKLFVVAAKCNFQPDHSHLCTVTRLEVSEADLIWSWDAAKAALGLGRSGSTGKPQALQEEIVIVKQ